MTTSQNGYKSRDPDLVAKYTIVRDVKIVLRKGDVSVVLLHFARWYDKNIEPLTKADTGGYNPRVIPGSKIDSNHASGTAEDLRWNKHPLGKKNTFTAEQKSKINKQLAFYEGVIRWGENYKGTVDGMHYEINKPPADVTRIANKIREAAKPKPPKKAFVKVTGVLDEPTIKLWQQIMKTKVTGKIDDENSALIRAVQVRLKATVDHRIVVDGDLGPKTIAGLQRYLKSPVDGYITKPKSQLVMALQRRLNEGRF